MAKLNDIAAHLVAQWQGRGAYSRLEGPLRPADMAEAYAAQAAYQTAAEPFRGRIAGRKIALASKTMQEMCGIDHPIAGGLFEKDIQLSPATVDLSHYRHLGLEFELALTLGEDVGPGAAPSDRAALRQLVISAHPAFELIEDRGADYAALDPMTMIADNAWCGGVVIGPEIPNWRRADLNDLPCLMTDPAGATHAANTGLADPLASLAFVLEAVTGQGQTVRAGETVITGSVLQTRFPKAGETYRYAIAGAEITVAFR